MNQVVLCKSRFGRLVCPWLLWTLLCGCPQSNAPVIDAQITISSTSGSAPLLVSVSGALSSSTAGQITGYAWDFGDNGTGDGVDATHTFTHPGRFSVRLTVTDSANNSAVAGVEVRVPGAAATAKINASAITGAAPLAVEFDGTGSSAPDDTIYDYYWDFGDQSSSRSSKPTHVYMNAGTYTVKLQVVTGGGVQAAAQAQIKVNTSNGGASLQFNGTQKATLPVASSSDLTTFALELWAKPDGNDGALATFGSPTTQLLQLSTSSQVRFRLGTITIDAATQNLVGGWHHFAVSYDAANVTLVVDGVSIGSGALTGATVAITQLLLGDSFHGKIADVRLWSTPRTVAQVQTDITTKPTGAETELLGYWPINEGLGEFLANKKTGAAEGFLGTDSSGEASDPAWSTDAP